jgi:CheY-like chemotaxis protein
MDDERPVRKIAQAMLESLGYTVECVINGNEAIERYRERLDEGIPFDATIMDLTIPSGLGGKDSARELLRLDPSARVIVSSGYSIDAVLADYRAHGFCAALGKPYRLQELADVMQEVLGDAPHGETGE